MSNDIDPDLKPKRLREQLLESVNQLWEVHAELSEFIESETEDKDDSSSSLKTQESWTERFPH